MQCKGANRGIIAFLINSVGSCECNCFCTTLSKYVFVTHDAPGDTCLLLCYWPPRHPRHPSSTQPSPADGRSSLAAVAVTGRKKKPFGGQTVRCHVHSPLPPRHPSKHPQIGLPDSSPHTLPAKPIALLPSEPHWAKHTGADRWECLIVCLSLRQPSRHVRIIQRSVGFATRHDHVCELAGREVGLSQARFFITSPICVNKSKVSAALKGPYLRAACRPEPGRD